MQAITSGFILGRMIMSFMIILGVTKESVAEPTKVAKRPLQWGGLGGRVEGDPTR